MRIGISTASYFTKIATEDCFAELKRIGVNVCEVFLSSASEYEGCIADAIVNNKSIDVDSIHALTNQFEPELFSLNMRAKADAMTVLHKVLAQGERLGARHYTFHGATMLKKTGYNHDYARLAAVVTEIIDIAESHNITLNYENVHWTYFSEPNYFAQLVQREPRLRATLDVKQALLSGHSYADYLDVMKGRLDVIHLCDYDDNNKLCLPGRGTFNYDTMFKRLVDCGYGGALEIEVYPQAYSDMNELKAAHEYIINIALRNGVDVH